MRITTVTSRNASDFDVRVNKLLADGWVLHGLTTTQTVAEQHQWDGGDINSQAVTVFSQVLKTDRQPSFLESN